MLRYLRNIGLAGLVGLCVAVIYYVLESSYVAAIKWLWLDTLNTTTHRLLVIPLAVILAVLYFWVLRTLDPKPEKREGLLSVPHDVSFKRILFILIIGFFSMFAGASLGPEAILFPACLIAGALVSKDWADKNDRQLITLSAVTALFTAFFGSFWVGVLTILLLYKQFKDRLPELIAYNVIACGVTLFTLREIFHKPAFVGIPKLYAFSLNEIAGIVVLLVLGMLATYWLRASFKAWEYVYSYMQKWQWIVLAAGSGLVLGLVYFFGNPLIEFTGNHSIEPMLQQAPGLGVLGLIGILLMKNIAIAWSRVSGYRGGMIFPTIFVAFTLVALVQQMGLHVNLAIGVVAALIGIFFAGRGTHIFE